MTSQDSSRPRDRSATPEGSSLVFESTGSATTPHGWTVRMGATGDVLGSVEWHDRIGCYGLALVPGVRTILPEGSAQAAWRFVEQANAERGALTD